jgi:hypothetical protein
VKIPLEESLSIYPFLGKKVEESPPSIYRLRGVVHHVGKTVSSGHYTTCGKRSICGKSDTSGPRENEEQWMLFDDRVGKKTSVNHVTDDEWNQKRCYMAIYELGEATVETDDSTLKEASQHTTLLRDSDDNPPAINEAAASIREDRVDKDLKDCVRARYAAPTASSLAKGGPSIPASLMPNSNKRKSNTATLRGSMHCDASLNVRRTSQNTQHCKDFWKDNVDQVHQFQKEIQKKNPQVSMHCNAASNEYGCLTMILFHAPFSTGGQGVRHGRNQEEEEHQRRSSSTSGRMSRRN